MAVSKVSLRADLTDLRKELKKVPGITETEAKAMVKRFEKQLKAAERASNKAWKKAKKKGPQNYAQAVSGMKGLFTAVIGGVAVQQVGRLVGAFGQLNDRIQDMRDQALEAGATVEDFQKVQGAIGLVTRDTTAAGDTIARFRRQLADARDGTGEAVDALGKLGISAADIADIPLDQQFEFIAAGVQQLGSQADRTAVLMDLFGRSGAKLIPLMKGGAAGIRAAFQEVEDAGLISQEAAERADALDDSMFLLRQTGNAVASDFLTEVSPALLETAESLRAMLTEARESGQLQDTAEAMARLVDSDVLSAIEDLSALTVFLTSATGKLADAYKVLTSTIKLPRAAVSDLITGSDKLGDSWEDLGDIGASMLFWMSDGTEHLTSLTVSMEDFAAETGWAGGELSAFNDELAQLTALGRSAVAHGPDKPKRKGARGRGQADAEEYVEGFRGTLRGDLGSVRDMDWGAELYGTQMLKAEEGLDAARERWRDKERARADEERQEHEDRMEMIRAEAGAYAGLADNVGSVFSSMGQIIVDTAEEGTEAHRRAAKAAVALQIAAAIATTTSSMIAAAATWASNEKDWKMGLAAIGVAVAEAVGLVAAITAAESNFEGAAGVYHTGGAIMGEPARDVPMIAQEGEWMVNRQGRRIAGDDTLEKINRGEDPWSTSVVAISVGNQTTQVMEYESLRTRSGPVWSLVRTQQPSRSYMRNPYAEIN